MLLMTLAALVVVSCGNVFDEYYSRTDSIIPETPEEPVDPVKPDPGEVTVDPDSYWYKAADSASMALLNRYWPPMLTEVAAWNDSYLNWHFTNSQDKKADANSNYWHQAHAIDPIIDAYNRTPTTKEYEDEKQLWLSIFDKWYQGVPRFQWMWNTTWSSNSWKNAFPSFTNYDSADGWRNEYIDDMDWMVLTLIRMYEALAVNDPDAAAKYLAKGKEIYDNFIWDWAWDAPGKGTGYSGTYGIYWKRDTSGTSSKNACSNGPSMIIAAKLSYYSTDTDDKTKYAQQAEDIYEWMISHLYNSTSGVVADNWNGSGSSGGALTYNQGTFIGGCHWLYKITDDEKYLTPAIKATEYTINSMQSAAPNGTRLLQSSSGATEGNNTAFRGIYIRYFIDIINEPTVDVMPNGTGLRQKWYDNLANWANYVWRDGLGVDKGTGISNPGQLLFGYDWSKKVTDAEISAGINLGNQLSGAILVEAMNTAKNPSAE